MSGIRSQLGVAKEVTYGTYVVPSDWLIFDAETLSRAQQYLTSIGLGSGALVPRSSLHRETTRGGEGSIQGKVPNQGFGLLLDQLHGNVVAPVQQGATAAYLQTHEIGETVPNKSLSVQVGKPTISTVQPFTARGCVPTQVVFGCELSGELTFDYQLDIRDLVTSDALGTNNPPADWSPRDFTEGEILINDVEATALIASFNLTIPMPRKTDRYGIGSGALKAYPLVNDYVRPTVQLSAEFTDMAMYNHYVNEDEIDVKVRFTGPEIATGEPEMIEFQFPAAKVVGSTPAVSGPDVLTSDVPIEVYADGTNPPVTILYQSRDTTL